MPFVKGQSGNPAGFKPGTSRKQRLVNKFWSDAYAVWLDKGYDCLETFATNDPGGFCRMFGSIMPREEQAKQISHQIEVTLKTPQWLTTIADETRETGAPDYTHIEPVLITHNPSDDSDSC